MWGVGFIMRWDAGVWRWTGNNTLKWFEINFNSTIVRLVNEGNDIKIMEVFKCSRLEDCCNAIRMG